MGRAERRVRGERATSGEMSATSEPRATPVQPGGPVPETQSPRSPLRTRRQCRGPSPGSVRLAVPRRYRDFRNSRQATARAQPAASAFERTAAPPGRAHAYSGVPGSGPAHLVPDFSIQLRSPLVQPHPAPGLPSPMHHFTTMQPT